MSARTLARALLAAAAAALAPAMPAFAQGLTIPPRHDSRSPTGVSYGTGAFTHEVRDLAIGGDFPQGLTLDRTYISNTGGRDLGGLGWTHNFAGMVTSHSVPLPAGWDPWPDYQAPYVYNVTVGGRSVGFRGGSSYPPTTGGPVGTYEPITRSGASLVYTGTTLGNGRYVFTDSDGTVVNFPLGYQPLRIQDWTMPDGTRLEFGYDPVTVALRSIISNRGYALLFEPVSVSGQRKVCAVNLTQHAVTATSTCPAGVQSATYTLANGPFTSYVKVLASATDANGQTTTYSYVSRDRLGCITLPGQSTCLIQNTYTNCYEYNPDTAQNEYRSDYVTAQQTATGETYAYAFGFLSMNEYPQRCLGPDGASVTQTVNGTATTTVHSNSANLPWMIVDPLGRITNLGYTGGVGEYHENEASLLSGIQYPLGNIAAFEYDARGNLNRQITRAVPGSGLADIESTAVYPATCVHRKTCNKPTSVTDARGNTTDYTYDNAHGGVLTETGPAPAAGGVRPQTRHIYAQRYAWISNGAGGYVQAATPIWLRTSSSICRASAATGNPASPCATTGDEVLTQYDYGPNSGPNTLLLRGQTVTSTDGGTPTTLRTCYGYDRDGRRISETQPNANLASCP